MNPQEQQATAIIVMGVSGVGKSTIGRLLAQRLGWPFLDADDFHPPANIEKMRGGQPLHDDDRWVWLEALRDVILKHLDRGQPVVLACSALKRAYREVLRTRPDGTDEPAVRFVYLEASRGLVQRRMQERTGHFMNPLLLESQFDALEAPQRAFVVDADQTPEQIVEEVAGAFQPASADGSNP